MAWKKQRGAMTSTNIIAEDALQHSLVAHIGHRCVRAAIGLQMIKHTLTLLMVVGLMALAFISPAVAQPAGATLGGNSSAPINAFRSALDIGVWVLLGLGIGGIGWGIYNVMFGNAWQRQMVGGGAALGFAGIVALINDVVNDQAPTTPTW